MDIYFQQQIDNSRVVRSADPRRRREVRTLMGAVVVLFLVGFAYTWQRFEVVRLGYNLAQAQQQSANLEQWNQGLQLQVAALRSPQRIYSLAEGQLGMQNAAPGQILALDVAPGAASPLQSASVTSLPSAAPRAVAAVLRNR